MHIYDAHVHVWRTQLEAHAYTEYTEYSTRILRCDYCLQSQGQEGESNSDTKYPRTQHFPTGHERPGRAAEHTVLPKTQQPGPLLGIGAGESPRGLGPLGDVHSAAAAAEDQSPVDKLHQSDEAKLFQRHGDHGGDQHGWICLSTNIVPLFLDVLETKCFKMV